MDIIEILDRESCSVDLSARSKDEVLHALAELAAQSPRASGTDAKTVYRLLAERESQGSTAFGNEIAIPHARVEGMTEFLLYIVVSPRGVDFDALDRKRVKLIFVILGPAKAVNEHLQILASVSRALGHTNVKNELIRSDTVTALYEAFVRNAAPGPEDEKEEQRKMQLLFLNLYDEDLLYNVLEIFLEEGIEGATIMDSAGMGQYISNVPLFADFIGFMRQNKNQSKTLMTLVPEEEVANLVDRIESVTGDLDKKQGAMIIVLDIAFMKGTMKML
jgi:mannitol/fructose-specific phosphotransferase system IIA component (Ntr-type)